MARIRCIKPELPQSESMGNVSRESRLCFILLFTVSDDYGKLRGSSRMLASLLYPYDDDAPKAIEVWLAELEREKCIVRYVVDGAHYIKILNWEKHQKVDRPSASKIPDPREDSAHAREDSRGFTVGSKDQGSKDQGSSGMQDKKGSRFTLTELPEEWELFCKQNRPDLDPNELFAEFLDYWIAVPGQKGCKLDWFATWRNRVREKKKDQRAKPAPKQKIHSENFTIFGVK